MFGYLVDVYYRLRYGVSLRSIRQVGVKIGKAASANPDTTCPIWISKSALREIPSWDIPLATVVRGSKTHINVGWRHKKNGRKTT